ncbi:ABC transporter ATP-binding protein [Peptostreptococcus sp. D1]|uniref:ABC transporter ATP-binding protein n=1 Tax=Peptostreptococcus sp. D1 TaxID=72304 RepID=UPI001FA91A3B
MLLVTVMDLYLPLLLKKIVDKGIIGKNFSTLLKLALIYLIIQLLAIFIEFILGYIYSIMRNSVAIKIRLRILRHISTLSGDYYTNKKTGNILSIVQSDIDTIESIDAELAFSLVKNFITATAALYFMIRLQYDLFLIVIFLQIVLILLQRIFTKMIHENVSLIRKEYGDITHLIQEYVLNIMSIVISKSKRFFISDYIKKDRKIINKNIKTHLLYSGNITAAITINSIITMILYGYGGYKIINGSLTLGALLAFQSYSAMLLGPCMSIVNANNKIQQAKVSIDRVYSLLGEKSDIASEKDSITLEKGNIEKIEFNKVNFGYTKDLNILKNVDLVFDRGNISALVGSSGCGKSTIINLLFRLWDVDSGCILIDGIDIKNINLYSLRKNISVVTQDSLIFDMSIRENICLGKKIDEEILKIICEKVGISEYISGLADGIDTKIGERGIKISGGQKQRIAIARTILSDSDIIILDEATSALDNISQKEIINNLKEFFDNKIVIVIAHRLSTIKDVDNIFVLDSGKIIGKGTHQALLKSSDSYRTLYYNE